MNTPSTVVPAQPSNVTKARDSGAPAIPSHMTVLSSSAGRGWNGFGAAFVRIPAGRTAVSPQSNHRLGMHIGTPVRANCRCDGRRSAGMQSQGDTNVLPAGIDGVWTDDAECTIMNVWFDDAFMRRTAEALGATATRHAAVQPRLLWRDKRVEYLVMALRAELETDDTSDALYAESLCTALAVRMISGTSEPDERKRRTLAPHIARRVIDFIEDRLDTRLVLTDIAAAAAISVPHLKVLFRETFGMPVHQYVIRQRTDRARTLLLQGRLSLSQIALEAGFAHPSHMAHWMKRILGAAPGEIVREHAASRVQGPG
jgi:AraC family transcriptional regulator